MIPFLDVGATYRELGPQIDAAVTKVLASGQYIGGDEVALFEAEFASYCMAEHCVGTGNGLDALVLALKALGVGPGDEVIVPSHTFIATWLAVSETGATIVPVEPLENTQNIDPDQIEAAITSSTKAVIIVHLYGQPCDLDPIVTVCRRHNVRLIEDAAQAHGASYKGTRIGGTADIACWSFYPGKNLGAFGDGGAVTTNDAAIAAQVRLLGNYGSSMKYKHDHVGVNSRLDPIHAAALRIKLTRLDAWNSHRQAIADIYLEGLARTSLALPDCLNNAQSAWHLFTVRTDDRDKLQTQLLKRGVQTLIHYPIAAHMQECYGHLQLAPDQFPLARRIADTTLSLPIGPHLSIKNATRVVTAVIECHA